MPFVHAGMSFLTIGFPQSHLMLGIGPRACTPATVVIGADRSDGGRLRLDGWEFDPGRPGAGDL
ncbi:hypothetical protein [Nonomuraea sp. NPDC049141]|uniref:hypothetical protein n=1 Tax=Nonomuraea sp. NPDC049141 TaxID=3155500 RepID=UPI0033ECA7E3